MNIRTKFEQDYLRPKHLQPYSEILNALIQQLKKEIQKREALSS